MNNLRHQPDGVYILLGSIKEVVLKIECLDATIRITNINKTMFGNRAMYKHTHKILTYKRVKLFLPFSLDDCRQRAADAGLMMLRGIKSMFFWGEILQSLGTIGTTPVKIC